MSQPDIIVTAPLPPFLYDPLKRDFRCVDYHAAADKAALLKNEGARIRGLAYTPKAWLTRSCSPPRLRQRAIWRRNRLPHYRPASD